ncbi:trehalase isoform X1, partial [Brachionus plicatilis]
MNSNSQDKFMKHEIIEAAKLYMNEKFLRCVKKANPNADSKSIVDRATRRPIEQVLMALQDLDEHNLEQIQQFVDTHLHEPGIEIIRAELTDWVEHPRFLKNIQSEELRHFCTALNRVWLDLYKKLDMSKLEHECVTSHLPMRHPFIVPGGRFIEIYYWDTYWTIEGLLVCGMIDTVRQMIENFVFFIKKFGFIPNGSRIYYLNRSQPPYFAQMVMRYYDHCMACDHLDATAKQEIENFVLTDAYKCILIEYRYWTRQKSVEILVDKRSKRKFKFSRYTVNTKMARPESYFEDMHTASQCRTDAQKHKLILSELSELNGDDLKAKLFKRLAAKRRYAINKLLWSKENCCWSDYNVKTGRLTDHFYASNLAPLWFDMRPPSGVRAADVIAKHRAVFDGYDAGVPVSLLKTTQQWDFNNVWAPNQHSYIMMLLKHEPRTALKLAKKFFNTVYHGWKRTGMIYE